MTDVVIYTPEEIMEMFANKYPQIDAIRTIEDFGNVYAELLKQVTFMKGNKDSSHFTSKTEDGNVELYKGGYNSYTTTYTIAQYEGGPQVRYMCEVDSLHRTIELYKGWMDSSVSRMLIDSKELEA